MRMDKKIRQAFRRATPNILGTLPAQKTSAGLKKRNRLSPRIQEFIATAASLALIVATIGIGTIYISSHYSTLLPTQPSSSTIFSVPTAPTDPSSGENPTIPYIAMFRALQVVLDDSGHPMEDLKEVSVTLDDRLVYHIFYLHGESSYSYYVRPKTGEIIAGGLHSDGYGNRADELREDLIGWRAARDIALESIMQSLDGLVGFHYEFFSEPKECYGVFLAHESSHGNTSGMYWIDAKTGELLLCDPRDEEQAVKIALAYTGYSPDDITDLTTSFDLSSGIWTVKFTVESVVYSFSIEVSTETVTDFQAFADQT